MNDQQSKKPVDDELSSEEREEWLCDDELTPEEREEIRQIRRDADREDAGLFLTQQIEHELSLGPDEYVDLTVEDGACVAIVKKI